MMTNDRPFTKWDMWAGMFFCASLSAITVIGMIATYATNGGAGILQVFVCCLPMAFLFVGASVKRAHDRIQALESRLRVLEAAHGAK